MKVHDKKKAGLTLWLFFLFVFFIYLLAADRVYHALSGKSYVKKIPGDLALPAGGDLDLLIVFDHSPVNNSFEEGKGFRGRFVRVADPGGRAKVRVFLRSADALYEAIENRGSFWADAGRKAVNCFASTTGLPKGIYQIGLQLTDDEGKKFVWLDSFFEKVAGGPVDYKAGPIAPVAARVNKSVKLSIERCIQKGREIEIMGWTVLADAEMSDFNAYVKVKSPDDAGKTFFAPLYTRSDVARRHRDRRAANSGFRIRIPLGELASGGLAVSIVLQSRKTGEAFESEPKQVKLRRKGRIRDPQK